MVSYPKNPNSNLESWRQLLNCILKFIIWLPITTSKFKPHMANLILQNSGGWGGKKKKKTEIPFQMSHYLNTETMKNLNETHEEKYTCEQCHRNFLRSRNYKLDSSVDTFYFLYCGCRPLHRLSTQDFCNKRQNYDEEFLWEQSLGRSRRRRKDVRLWGCEVDGNGSGQANGKLWC